MTTIEEAIKTLTDNGYKVIPPEVILSEAGKYFYDYIKRCLPNAYDVTAKHDVVYNAYDVTTRVYYPDWHDIRNVIAELDPEVSALE
jgi:hypothetical protein